MGTHEIWKAECRLAFAGNLLERLTGGEEVGHEAVVVLVGHAADHRGTHGARLGLWHLLLAGPLLEVRRVRVEDHERTNELEELHSAKRHVDRLAIEHILYSYSYVYAGSIRNDEKESEVNIRRRRAEWALSRRALCSAYCNAL